MNTYRYHEEQIRQWVRQKLSKEKSVKQICKEAVISRATLYNWMKEFSGDASALDKSVESYLPVQLSTQTPVRSAGRKNAPGALSDYKMLSSALAQVDTDGVVAKKMVGVLVKRFTITVARACQIVGIDEAAYGYKPRKPEVPDSLVSATITALIDEDPYRGFNDCYELLRKTHPSWTRKQIKRVYREQRLYLRRTRARRNQDGSMGAKTERFAPVRLSRPGVTWFLGMIESPSNWHLLFIIDEEDMRPLNARLYTGKFSDEDLVGFLSIAVNENGKPRKLMLAGKPPLNTRELTSWIWQQKLVLHTLSVNKPESIDLIARMERTAALRFADADRPVDDLEASVERWLAGE